MDTVAVSGKEEGPVPEAKRGSLAAADETARRGMGKARSFQYLERLNKSLQNLRMTNKSFEHLEWTFAEEDEEAWDEALKGMAAKGNEALGPSAGAAGEASGEEELAEKTTDCDEEKIDSIALSLAKYICEAMRSIEEEENKALAPSVEEEHPFGEEGLHDTNIDYHDTFTILGVEVADILGMRGENEGTALWRVRMAQLGEEATRERLKERLRLELELGRAGERKVEEPREEDTEMKRSDYEAWVASQFRDEWTARYSSSYGSFDDTTRLGPMRFTDEPAPGYTAFPIGTLQVFSVKVAGIKRSLQWPLDVFGFVADRYFVLTGPTRAIVWPTHVTIEVKLIMKGATEYEDKDLSFLADPLFGRDVRYPYLFRRYKTSKLTTLEFTLGHIIDSVEATIFVRVIDGSWPDSRAGQFAAFSTTGVRDKDFRSIDRQKIVLLDSRGDKVPVTGDGEIELLRRVVSVETSGTLKICVKSWETCKRNVVEDEWVFTPQEAKRSNGRLDTGFCKMELDVAWSLNSYHPAPLRVAFPFLEG